MIILVFLQHLTFVFQSKDVTFRGHSDSVDQLCWHPKHADQLVTASGDKTIRLWDARSNKSIATVNTKGIIIQTCYIFWLHCTVSS